MSPYPRVGFACLWDEDPRKTWSYTPWHLREALRERADVVDVGVDIPPRVRAALRAMHVRPRHGRLATTWKYSGVTDEYCRRALLRSIAESGCDAVLQIQDIAPLPVPFFLYQDLSYDALLSVHDPDNERAVLPNISVGMMHRRRERQLAIYARATGVLAMSEWFARTLVEVTGLPAEKVHVVHPGITSAADPARPIPERQGPRRRLLFVGGDFRRKGGALVVAATELLRRDFDPAVTLTVAGPPAWPLPGEPPEGVRFLGQLPPAEVAALWDTHDLFVMPSHLEAFGIVFAEALARGVPCVGRDAFAMPEIIRPGENGGLVRGDDPAELAETIVKILEDDALYADCRDGAAATAEWFSWDRAARQSLEAIRAV
ncbi:glycosyltransferase family 4 protein [Planotetraspora sp. GP83]|uniref:glycosyltransferase family 4 protein n=1 Tax=Planotetraspora sp. GP83 TaxID=3156264 RepID=UPI00387EDC22